MRNTDCKETVYTRLAEFPWLMILIFGALCLMTYFLEH